MPDAFGSMVLESNGLSYVKFDLGVDTYKIKSGKTEEKFVFSSDCGFRFNIYMYI